jgi:methyl coenzyme M reductase gamma subunit
MKKVLVTWIAKNNDPFETDFQGNAKTGQNGKPVHGPTLALLFDEDSFLYKQVKDVVFLYPCTTKSKSQ